MLYLLVFLVAWSTEIQLNDSIIESYFNQFKISVYLVKEVNEQCVQLSHVEFGMPFKIKWDNIFVKIIVKIGWNNSINLLPEFNEYLR